MNITKKTPLYDGEVYRFEFDGAEPMTIKPAGVGLERLITQAKARVRALESFRTPISS